ncbi:hypothetical protein [Brevundimonas mediterranea]|uniref:Uncharacterized protein n=1 Tax=Brevundimonas mediterranea TaxID=74329 RepID=A0A7W6F057_9CAUL|nr:hypothetical protein [Brevundimonas mediterranea]MBB3872413.1 hypothetical protein [Brevundimonas mediterranea]
MRTGRALFLAAVLAGTAGAAHAQMSAARIAAGFSEGVTNVCMPAVAAPGGIAALPDSIRALVSPAPEDARFLAQSRNPTGPIWNLESAKGGVIVSEPGPGQCEVIAYGPPVAATFRSTAQVLTGAAFVEDVAARRGPPFLRYEFSGTGSEAGVKVVLEGSEPGAPGRMFRFSLLSGYVTFAQSSDQ